MSPYILRGIRNVSDKNCEYFFFHFFPQNSVHDSSVHNCYRYCKMSFNDAECLAAFHQYCHSALKYTV